MYVSRTCEQIRQEPNRRCTPPHEARYAQTPSFLLLDSTSKWAGEWGTCMRVCVCVGGGGGGDDARWRCRAESTESEETTDKGLSTDVQVLGRTGQELVEWEAKGACR